MTRSLRTFGALLLILMTMSSALMPLALAAGSFSHTFGDGAEQKEANIPLGGGDSSAISLKLLPNETVKHLDVTLSPEPTFTNVSIVFPRDEGFQSGNYSDRSLSVDNAALEAKLYSFDHFDYFTDSKGTDQSSTTANLLYNEGLSGVSLSSNTTANLTTVLESNHNGFVRKDFDWGGRYIKNLTINASGNANSYIQGGVQAWNSQTMKWDILFQNNNMGTLLNHATMVQQNYTVPLYSKLTVGLNAQFVGTIWFNMNVTYEGYNNKSVVTSLPIDPVHSFNWNPGGTINDCHFDATRVVPSNTHMSFELSPDNGTTWESTNAVGDHTFQTLGAVLRWRADLSADVINVTPTLRSVILTCHRNSDPGIYTWHSRDYHISQGAIVSYSISWYGDISPQTAVYGLAQRWSQDPALVLGNGDIDSFEYNTSLHNISFSLFLTPTEVLSPHLTKVVFNYTVVVMPTEVAIDVGNDGTVEWSHAGELSTDYRINGSDAKPLVAALNAKVPRSGGPVNVPLRVLSSTGASVLLHNLTLEYGLPPVLKTRISVISVNEDSNKTSVLSLDDYFTDDYDPLHLNYTVSYMEDPSKVLATVRGPLLDLWLPTRYWNGPSTIRIMATDKDGTSTQSNDIMVMVWPVNAPPVFTYLPSDIPAYVGAKFIGQVKAYDPEGYNLTYSLDKGLPDAKIDPNSGLFSWRPQSAQNKVFIVNITDGTNSVMAIFNLTPVVDYTKASPPVFTSVPVTEATATQSYYYNAKAVDLDGDPMQFQLVAQPDGMTLDASSGQVQWWPTDVQLGYNNVTLRVTDGVFITDQNFRVLVLNSPSHNKPPQINSNPPLNAWVAKPYMYQLKAKDPDPGTVLTYKLLQGTTDMSLDDGGRLLWVPTANNVGDHLVKVIVSDGVVEVPQSWTITVHSTERACVISSPAPNEVIKDKIVIKGLASGPNNLTKVEIRVGDNDNWMTANGTNKWRMDLNTTNLGTGYFYIRARACDGITCSKESEVRFYHKGSGAAVSSAISPYWYAVILVLIIIVVLLIIDLKVKFIKGPQGKKTSLEDEDLEIEPDERSVYHKKDR